MGRRKKFGDNAERMRAYRQRNKAKGKKTDGRQRIDRLYDYHRTHPDYSKKNKIRKFVAIDTEGITRRGKHICVLLGDSNGGYIEEYKQGIATHQAFDFLIECGRGQSIVVGFSIGYDINMILRDCDDLTLLRLSMGMRATQKYANGKIYSINWMPGKSFYVARLNTEKKIEESVTVYDVFGFFQKAFVKTAREYSVITPEEDKFLSQMKSDRSSFKESDKRQVRDYNLLECRVLVRIMDTLRDAMRIADCVPERWHGAGAIAATLMKRNGMKEHNHTPDEMQKYFLGAYFGGRIQLLQMGEHHKVFTHDIISAYPAAMTELPSSNGVWKRTNKFLPGERFAVYVVEWNLPPSSIIAPFPFRENRKGVRGIAYPMKGKGTYWFPEVEAAIRHYGDKIKIHYGFYLSQMEENAFSWIKELFEMRKRFKLATDPKEQLANIPVKLGLNSLYGKTAQGIGFSRNGVAERPAYQNYFWSGWITSRTRARMFDLAMKNPKNVIAFATDGLFSYDKLTETGSELGEWEVDQANYLFVLKAGIYGFSQSDDLECHNETGDPKKCKELCHHMAMKSRGHFMRDLPFSKLQALWRSDGMFATFKYKTTKFFGLKVSLQKGYQFKDQWRKWLEVDRQVRFFPSNVYNDEPDKIESVKRLRAYAVSGSSLPYEPKGDWYEGQEGIDLLSELDQLDSFYD